VFHSDRPDRYPLNTNTALIVNVPLAYTFYVLPMVFSKPRWLGLAPALFGFGQAVGHGLIFNRLAKDRYSPGFLASLLLHVPIGIQYLRALREDAPIERSDLARAGAYTVAFAVSSIAAPNVLLSDKNSPHRFTPKQVGRHTSGHRPPGLPRQQTTRSARNACARSRASATSDASFSMPHGGHAQRSPIVGERVMSTLLLGIEPATGVPGRSVPRCQSVPRGASQRQPCPVTPAMRSKSSS
jgi:hypothetical protein